MQKISLPRNVVMFKYYSPLLYSMLDYFFRPSSVAVIGASRNPKKFGYIVFQNFFESGFNGNVWPVNPNAETVYGERCYPNIMAINEKVDLAVIVVPGEKVVEAVANCAEKGVKACIILSAGFAETGNTQGEEEVMKVKGNMRILGPNVIGIYDSYSCVDTIFNTRYRQGRPKRGTISFISQSGALGAALMDWCSLSGIGLAKFISIGNRLDCDEIDFLTYLEHDRNTEIIVLYLEGAKNGRLLFEKLREIRKPVIAIKSGTTEAGQSAAMSHTGSMAGQSMIYSGMFKQSGVIEAADPEEMFDFAKVFSQPLPIGNRSRIQIITNGGGFGVLAADAIIHNGLEIAALDKKTIDKIANTVPKHVNVSNPLDLTGDADKLRYKAALEAIVEDDNIDAIMVIILFQVSVVESDIVNIIIDINKRCRKPLIICSTGGEFAELHRRLFEQAGIPVYSSPMRAAKALKALFNHVKYQITKIKNKT